MEEDRTTDAPPWLDVDDIEPTRPTTPDRGRRLAVLAGVPWALAAALLWTRPVAPAPELDEALAAEVTPSDAPALGAGRSVDPTPVPTDAPPRTDAPVATITASGGWTAVGQDEARAVAVVAARRWLTSVGPADGSDGADAGATSGRYAEHLVVEGVDHPAPGAAVVTVRAVVLSVAGDGYDRVDVVRLAVPLRFDADGARPAGEPWLLPVDEPTAAPFELAGAIEDTEILLLAGEALAAAGYRDVAVRTLHRTDGWPLVVTADARLADDAPPERVVVWLRQHLGRLVVAGTRPGTERPSPTTSDGRAPSPPPVDDHHDHEEATP